MIIIDGSNYVVDNYEEFEKNVYIITSKIKQDKEKLKESCYALYNISLALKKNKVFMKWCIENNIYKDKVSEYFKRFKLYEVTKDEDHEYISSLSNNSVKKLSHKKVGKELLNKIVKERISKADEIEAFFKVNIVGIKKNKNDYYEKYIKLKKQFEELEIKYALATQMNLMHVKNRGGTCLYQKNV